MKHFVWEETMAGNEIEFSPIHKEILVLKLQIILLLFRIYFFFLIKNSIYISIIFIEINQKFCKLIY